MVHVGHGLGVHARQAHDEPRARSGVLEAHVAAVGLGDRANDREAQPGRRAAVTAGAHEALEDAIAQLGWDAGPVVGHDQHGVIAV